MSPYSFDLSPSASDSGQPVCHDSIPIGAIPLMSTSSPNYNNYVSETVQSANKVYTDYIHSSQGIGFSGQVAFIGK